MASTPSARAAAGPLAAAFLSGLAVTLIEFAAARQLAVAFGQSVHVWAAVIGLLLLALALGYAAGGRLAARGGSPRPLAALLALGAAWTFAAALLGPALARALTPTGLPVPGGMPLGLVASVLAVLASFTTPLVALGLVTPWLVRAAEGAAPAGARAGRIYAAGTFGSLVGCGAAPLWLLQEVGTRATLWVAAGLLAAVGGWLLASAPLAPTPAQGPAVPGGLAGRGRVRSLAFVAGAATLAAEFLAVRLFSPWCGQSNRVWANTIGVILFALALGAWLGERLASTGDPRRRLAWVLGLGGLALLPAALLGPALAEHLVPRGIDSMRVLPVAFAGSLAATATLFGPATLLLGAAAPLLVRDLAGRLGSGRAAGLVSAWGTLGALVGSFAGPLLLVPGLGSRRALLALGLATAAAAALAAPWRRGARLSVAAGLAGGLALALVGGRIDVRAHPGQLVEVETAYQTVRAVREEISMLVPGPDPWGEGEEVLAPAVFLRHDEDAETYQSVCVLERSSEMLTGGRYFEQMALGARLVAKERVPGTLRVLIVGYAGGAVHRVLRDTLPPGLTLEVLGIEIDPAVVEVAREHLALGELEGPGLTLVTGEDGRTVVNALPADQVFDLVLVDAYARTNYVPFQLATREFFERVKRHLAPEGWVGVNVLGRGLSGGVCRAVATTLDTAIGPTYLHPNLWFPGSTILWSTPQAGERPRITLRSAEDRLAPLLEVTAFALERVAVRHVPAADGGELLTDDRSPSDRLADEELGL